MDRQDRIGDTVLVGVERWHVGRTQTLPWWLEGEGVKTTENEIRVHWSRCYTLFEALSLVLTYFSSYKTHIRWLLVCIMNSDVNNIFVILYLVQKKCSIPVKEKYILDTRTQWWSCTLYTVKKKEKCSRVYRVGSPMRHKPIPSKFHIIFKGIVFKAYCIYIYCNSKLKGTWQRGGFSGVFCRNRFGIDSLH